MLLTRGNLPQTHHALAILRVDVKQLPAGRRVTLDQIIAQKDDEGLVHDQAAGAQNRVTQTARLRLANGRDVRQIGQPAYHLQFHVLALAFQQLL